MSKKYPWTTTYNVVLTMNHEVSNELLNERWMERKLNKSLDETRVKVISVDPTITVPDRDPAGEIDSTCRAEMEMAGVEEFIRPYLEKVEWALADSDKPDLHEAAVKLGLPYKVVCHTFQMLLFEWPFQLPTVRDANTPQRYRMILYHRWLMGKTYKHIGNRLGLSGSRVKQLESRAIHHIRRIASSRRTKATA